MTVEEQGLVINAIKKCLDSRVPDVVLSLCALIVLSPLMLILIILAAVKMKGIPFFVQEKPVRMKRYSR